MSALIQTAPGIWRWDGTDADHGFPIVGHIVAGEQGLILIDPPGTSGEASEIQALGKPAEIVITGKWHVRGAPKWAGEFSVPILAPASARGELEEANRKADRELSDGDRVGEWHVLLLHAEGQGESAYDEIALWHEGKGLLVVGDLFGEDEEGRVGLGPHLFAGIPVEALVPAVRRLQSLQPKWILSSHLGHRSDVENIFASVLAT